MIFCPVVSSLDHLSIHLLLFRLEKYLSGQVVSAFCFSSSVEERSESSIPLDPWSLCKAHKFVCMFHKPKLRLTHFWWLGFCMKFKFTEITQVWVHYFKSFSRLKSTQDEKVHYFYGNKLKLTQVELLSFFYIKRARFMGFSTRIL